MKPVEQYTCEGPRRIDDDLLEDLTPEIGNRLYRNVIVPGFPPDIEYRLYDFAQEIKKLREAYRVAVAYLETQGKEARIAAEILEGLLGDA